MWKINEPSLNKNQASKNQKVFLNFLISFGSSILPSLRHASATLLNAPVAVPSITSPDLTAGLVEPPGSHIALGKLNAPHHTPVKAMLSLKLHVLPFINVTGMRRIRRRVIPAEYPIAIPVDDIREVVRDMSF